jgi:hypothetical protein
MRLQNAVHGDRTVPRQRYGPNLPAFVGERAFPAERLAYVDSWIEPNFARCFQLMRGDDPKLFQEWVLQWRGLGVTFEIVPVVPSKETQAVVAPYLDTSARYSEPG